MAENIEREFNLLKEYIDYFTDKNVELHKKYSDYCLNEMIKTRFNKPVSFEDWKKLYGWGEPLSFENWKQYYGYAV